MDTLLTVSPDGTLELSPDEFMALMASAGIAAVAWGRWYYLVLAYPRFGGMAAGRVALLMAPIGCMLLVFMSLQLFADREVRNAIQYLALYTLMGAAWVGAATVGFRCMGVCARDDAIERANPAVSVAVLGAVVGITFAYAGGNFGDGPGWWVVVFSAALATAGLFGMWLLAEAGSHISEHVTIERDVASGLRLAGLLVGGGLIMGRAVAGDWISFGGTVRDFVVVGWPVLVLAVTEVLIGRVCRPTLLRPAPSVAMCGALPALVYIGLGISWLMLIGPW